MNNNFDPDGHSDAFHLVTNLVDLFELRTKTSVPPALCLEDLLASGTITLDQRQVLFYIEPPVCSYLHRCLLLILLTEIVCSEHGPP